ncbi:MAG: aminopeptidase, partial [Actinomycetota bacterium]|nr:aminopeptidase [Actinomycetota bacterium]
MQRRRHRRARILRPLTKANLTLLSASVRMNVTRAEAQARARLLDVEGYDVVLDLTIGDVTFGSTTTARFSCTEPGAETFVDLVADRVDEITLNGRALDPATVYDGTRITLTDLAADNELVVRASCRYMHTGEGLHRFVDPVDKSVYVYTQFEVADSRRVFTVFEQPDLKATFAFTVTAPADWEVVSNQPTPKPEPVGLGNATWTFAPTERLSSYITALVAGPYHRVDGEYRVGDRVVPLGVFCRTSLAAHLDTDTILEETRQGFAFFEEAFDMAYPFAKYDQLFVPEYNSGAMENAGCVTLNEDYVFRSRVPEVSYERRAVTILHELAHMWFGDLVTMTWWDDLWLNESFAEWASTLAAAEATRWDSAWTTFANTDKTWAYRQDQLPSTHPIAAEIHDLEDVEVNFDGITYAKGASVLKLLAAWVGREDFLAGIQAYFRTFAWGNTTLADLLGKLEETSGRDLKAWSAEWLETAGVNTLRPEIETDDDGLFTSFTIVQSAPAAWPTLRSHRLAIGLYDLTDAGLVRRDRVELDVLGARTEVPQLVGVAQPDLVLVNDDDLTYAKVRLDPRSLATLTGSIGEFADRLARSLCWSAAWDMTRDAEMSTQDYVTLVLGGVGRETDSSVVRTLLRQAETAVILYADPTTRDATMQRLADGLLGLLRAAVPGSDSQLQITRAFASAAVSDAQLAIVRAVLDGTEQLDGLTIDTDLRWHLLHQLVAAGKADELEVDRELDADDTATGRRQAAAALAARPDAAAKAEAWSAVVAGDELPNAIQTAMIGGFSQAGQLDLLRAYVAPYFDALTTVWEERTNETAQNVVIGLFPTLLAEQATVDAADAWLRAHQDAAPALRRLVGESRDGVARALR